MKNSVYTYKRKKRASKKLHSEHVQFFDELFSNSLLDVNDTPDTELLFSIDLIPFTFEELV